MPPRSSPLSNSLVDTWGRNNRSLNDKLCENCGVSFRPHRAASKYCSRRCSWDNNGGQNKKPETWWLSSKGYVNGRIWIGDKQKAVKFHRVVTERHLGRTLLPDEDVHHIDGNKLNNDLTNLEVVKHGEHSRIHHMVRAAARGK